MCSDSGESHSHCIVTPGAFNELKYSETELIDTGKTKENPVKRTQV